MGRALGTTLTAVGCLFLVLLWAKWWHEPSFRNAQMVLGDEDDVALQGPLLQAFESWMKAHNKLYPSLEERKQRFRNFVESWKRVLKHNAKSSSYTLGLTPLADLSDEEFETQFVQKRPLRECWYADDSIPVEALETSAQFPHIVPKQRDWRLEGAVSPVKNQGRCGSCWAFSAIGALEAAYKIKHGKNIILSEQQLLDCSYGYGNEGCNGGFPARAFEYARLSGGLAAEEIYPYEMASNGSESCRFQKKQASLKIHRVVNVTEGDEAALERAVGLHGPVAVAFVTTRDFSLYTGGIFTTEDCGPSRARDLTHAVLAVGYGETYDGKKYWILKNSWGDRWGVNGYFLMERGRNLCGIATCAAYAVIE